MKGKWKLLIGGAVLAGGLSLAIPATSEAATLTGWQKEGSFWYYYDANGNAATGWKKIGTKWYFFDSDGAMHTGLVIYNGKGYFMDETSGAMRTGWIKVKNTDYDASPGDGNWTYADSNGVLKSGWIQSGGKWYYLEGSVYYHNENWKGIPLIKESTAYQIGNSYYLFDANGVLQEKSGWHEMIPYYDQNPRKYYIGQGGKLYIGWKKIDGKLYHFNQNYDGSMDTGTLEEENGKWYFLDWDTGELRTGWVEVGECYSYAEKDGTLVGGGWKKIDGKLYYFDPVFDYVYTEDGKSTWVRFYGTLATDEFIQGYRLGKDGALTSTVKFSWIKTKAGTRYGTASGVYLKGKGYQIDGKMYMFDANGYVTKISENLNTSLCRGTGAKHEFCVWGEGKSFDDDVVLRCNEYFNKEYNMDVEYFAVVETDGTYYCKIGNPSGYRAYRPYYVQTKKITDIDIRKAFNSKTYADVPGIDSYLWNLKKTSTVYIFEVSAKGVKKVDQLSYLDVMKRTWYSGE